jgi:hypothetical protein
LDEDDEGRRPSSRNGLRVRAVTHDFVQSPTRFLAAVEADEAFGAMGFFPLPMVAEGSGCLSLKERWKWRTKQGRRKENEDVMQG